jgi:hypothetical protein
MSKIVYVGSDNDWCGLYINGKLVYENHSIPTLTFAELMMSNQPIESFNMQYADSDWIYERENLPEDLNEVVFEYE